METSNSSAGETPGFNERKPRRLKLWLVVLIGVVGCLVAAGLGGLVGYNGALGERAQLQAQEDAKQVTAQYQLALADLSAGRYEIASQRLQYILQLDPKDPQAATQLVAAQAAIRATQSVTPTASPGVASSATPGSAEGAQARLDQVRSLLAGQSWQQALEALDKFRADFPGQEPLAVDGLYYSTYRNLGVTQIAQQGVFTSGIYYLSLAQRYAPLDRDASKYLNWAQLYLTAMSGWNANWPQVISSFSQITPFMGGLRDSSGLTAWERLRQARIQYGDQLLKQGNPCAAQQQYEGALAAKEDPSVRSALATAQAQCTSSGTPNPGQVTGTPAAPGSPTPSATSGGQASPTPTLAAPTTTHPATPAVTPSPSG